jgi:hypothetical protein
MIEFPQTDLASAINQVLDASFTLDRWSIHGLRCEFQTDHPILRDLMRHMLQLFPIDRSAAPTDVRVCVTTRRRWSVPREAEVFPATNNGVIDLQAEYKLTSRLARLGDLNYSELSPLGGVAYHLRSGQALGYVTDPPSWNSWLVSHLFLQMIWLEMLRGQNLFWIHSAAVADQDRCVLLTGITGSGKTTTCLKLMEGGFKFLSEDRSFIRSNAGAVEVLSFAEDVAVTENTVNLLPWLRDRITAQPVNRRRKIELDPAQLFPDALIERARPGLILFPRVASIEKSETRRLNSATALQRILPSSLLASQPDISALNFDALTQLVTSSRSYELLLGPDIDRLPDLVRDLLKE